METLLLNEEDGGSCFAFGFGKKETFYLFVICYDVHPLMYKCMYCVILLHCCFNEMPVFQNLKMLFFVAFFKRKIKKVS